MIMITETTTLWLDTPKANIVRVLYISNTGWEKTIMADIDLHNEKVDLIMGKDSKNHGQIIQFQNTIYSQTDLALLGVT